MNGQIQVIMPIGFDQQAEIKQAIIQRIANVHGFTPLFPYYIENSYTFDLDSTIENLKLVDFVVVDLSFARPSCYYELGIAEAVKAKVFLIAEENTDIHQTASREFVRFYSNLAHLELVLFEILAEAQGETS